MKKTAKTKSFLPTFLPARPSNSATGGRHLPTKTQGGEAGFLVNNDGPRETNLSQRQN